MKSDEINELMIDKSIEIVKTYRTFFILTSVGVSLAILLSSKDASDKWWSILALLIVLSFNFLIIKLAEEKKISGKTLEILMFLTMVLIYLMAIYVSMERSVWTPINWFASLFIVMFSMFNKRLLIAYLIFHSIFVTSIFFINPSNIIILEKAHLISILSNVLVLGVIGYRYTGIFNKFESDLISQVQLVSEKNDELQAINEEYYAAQEELYQQYDMIKNLLSEKELINEQFSNVIDATEEMIIDYNVQEDSYKISKNLSNFLPESNQISSDLRVLINRLKTSEAELLLSEFERVKSGSADLYKNTFFYTSNEGAESYYQVGLIGFDSKINGNRHIIITINDVTVQRKAELKIYEMAYHDDLTNLLNRKGFEKAVQEYMMTDQLGPFNFILINISEFHLINSVLGYEVGDEVLKYMARRIAESIPSPITPSRLSSDNFALIVSQDVSLKALKGLLEDPIILNELKIAIRVNLGITQYPNFAVTYLDLIRQAELALAASKKLPSVSYYFYNENLVSNYQRRLLLINMMRHSILTNEFSAHFQPIIHTKTNQIVGFEALARWYSKQEGNISPAEFIPLAEQIGYIHNLGKLILRKACDLIIKLGENKKNVTISVNLSSVQFLSSHLASELIMIIDDFLIPHDCIAFEVTESILIDNFEAALKQLRILRNAGFKIYLDDFGTGYSSLSYLTNLPIDVLKLDRSFTSEATLDERKYSFLVAIVQMAKVLGLKIVAEGIETQSQFNKVRNAGIESIQGYFFSKPLDEKDALTYLKEYSGNPIS